MDEISLFPGDELFGNVRFSNFYFGFGLISLVQRHPVLPDFSSLVKFKSRQSFLLF